MRLSSPGRWAVLILVSIAGCDSASDTNPDPIQPDGGGGMGGASSSSGGGGVTTSSAGGSGGSGGDGGSQGGGPPANPCGDSDGVCLAAIPDPWTGYFFLYSTGFGAGSETCQDGSASIPFFSDPSTTPAICSACACGDPSITCQGHLDAYLDSNCNGGAIPYDIDTTCTITGVNVNGVLTKLATTSSAICQASGGVPSPLDPPWTQEHRLCAADVLPIEDCQSGEACVGKEPGIKVCIKADGPVAACPAGWEDAVRYERYLDAIDGRGCDACSCDPPAGNLCDGGTYQFFNTANCSGAVTYSTGESAACLGTFNSNSARYVSPGPGGAACAPAGGAPSGAVVAGPVAATLCCRD